MNKAVSKEEFEKFISEYPNKLEIDYFMDWYSYNDFSLNGGCVWPESMVAMKSDGSYDQPIEYKILLEEYWENRDIDYKNGICKFAIEREDSRGSQQHHPLQLVARIDVDDLVKLFDEAPTNFDGENPICKVKDPIKFTEFVIRRLWDDAPYEADDVVWAQPLTYIFEQLLEDYKPEFLEYFDEI